MTSVLDRPAPGPERTIGYGDAPDQVLELWPGGAPGRPLVALVHGGFWRPAIDRTHLRPMATALHVLGWPVASLEYRRTPGDPEASASDVLDGLRAAGAEAGPEGVVTVGHSAGGHLVLYAAVTEPELVRGTVALAPVADLALAERKGLGDGAVRDFLGGPAAGHAELDPVLLATPPGPVTIVHGDADDRVPAGNSASYVERHPSTRFVELSGVDHFGVVDPLSPAWESVVTEIHGAGAAH